MAASPVDRSAGAVPAVRPTVGLEIHARLQTQAKLFCACTNRYGARPNSLTCPVCLGLPGTLPVLNRDAVELALRAGLALGCRIETASEFARKNYFYPDLPRNYQITQYEHPLCRDGELTIDHPQRPGDGLRVRLERIHLEEDAGRSRRLDEATFAVDLNRAGTPLIEIVTRPDLSNGDEARAWLKRLRQILQYLGVCDGLMAEGSLRCDANIGLASAESGGKTADRPWSELKNLNSFRAVGRGIDYEIERLQRRLTSGRDLQRQTRSWNEAAGRTEFLRRKETSADYRYFPEPDLPVLRLDAAEIDAQQVALPELPQARERRFLEQYGLPHSESVTLCATKDMADDFEDVVKGLGAGHAALAGHWFCTEVLAAAADRGVPVGELGVPAAAMADLLRLVVQEVVSVTGAKQVFAEMLRRGPETRPADLVADLDLQQVSDETTLGTWCHEVLAGHPEQAGAYRAGKLGVLDFLVGQVMARSAGRANPRRVRARLEALLASSETPSDGG